MLICRSCPVIEVNNHRQGVEMSIQFKRIFRKTANYLADNYYICRKNEDYG